MMESGIRKVWVCAYLVNNNHSFNDWVEPAGALSLSNYSFLAVIISLVDYSGPSGHCKINKEYN